MNRIRLSALVIGVLFLLVGGPKTSIAAVAALAPFAALYVWLSSPGKHNEHSYQRR